MSKDQSEQRRLSPKQSERLINVLQARFAKHRHRHTALEWEAVRARLEVSPAKLWSLHQMEDSGGEPDVVRQDNKTGEFVFVDCSEQTPAGRVSLCYDEEALAARKEHKPKDSAEGLAAAMGIELLTEGEYLALQELGEFDTKRSSWIKTPPAMRKLGGALYAERRYGRIFIGHNGAQSYYAVRGFRGVLRV